MASSCCRPSALTSSRFATLAQAMKSTIPTVPIRTHRDARRHRSHPASTAERPDLIRASSRILELFPERDGICAAASEAFARHRHWLARCHARFEPGDCLKAEVANENLVAIEAKGKNQSGIAIQETEILGHNSDDFPRTAIDHDAPSQTDGSPPNLRCQYPKVRMMVSGGPGESSSRENQRPSTRLYPQNRKHAVCHHQGSSSGSAMPVTLADWLAHRPIS